ncbi:hypothetical protein ABT288_27745 [Streptomyces sp. NPDC001093]|uniref:hypothetical protein n=1 Tax=Streptomyces sp. NPDC001093 TaxID=3154376 RepID=UPI0033303B71
MTTRSTTPQPSSDGLDAPALPFEVLSDRQRQGASGRWCSGTPDRRFPVRILRALGVRLYACKYCAGMHGVTEVER